MTPLKCKHRCLTYFKMMSKTDFLEEERERRRRKKDHAECAMKRARQIGVPSDLVSTVTKCWACPSLPSPSSPAVFLWTSCLISLSEFSKD